MIMIEDINSMIERIYQKSTGRISQVYEVFKDYFDEERVDIQGIPTLESFKQRLTNSCYNSFMSRTAIINSNAWNEASEQDKEIVKALLAEGVLNTLITSDETVFKYMFPFLLECYNGTSTRMAYIIVRFPEVRVSNENDKYVDIKELYARVKVTERGKIEGTFGLLRADYPLSHIYADYAHSHISGLTLNRDGFLSPCLGTGPINRTILSLVEEFDLSLWMLFCRELDTYVTVESLTGVPYRRLENITGDRRLRKLPQRFSDSIHVNKISYLWERKNLPMEELHNFIVYLLGKDIIKFNRNNGAYNLAMGYKDYIVNVSNAFIYYVNNYIERSATNEVLFSLNNLTSIGVLNPYAIKNGEIYAFSNNGYSADGYLRENGKALLMFKGSEVRLNIYNDISREEDNTVYLLDFNLCETILTNLIVYLNYANGKTHSNAQVGPCKKCIVI